MKVLLTCGLQLALTGLALLPCLQGHEARRHLFLDPDTMARSSGTVLSVNGPQSREVVIRPDRPWEQGMISFYTTVIDDHGKLRLWYICRDLANQPNLAYAESADGLTWTKPNLGIVDYHGSKDNNLVGVASLDGAVFRDPRAQPGEEYVYVGHVAGEGVFRFFSPDGWHWRRDPRALLAFRSDTQNVAFWDEVQHHYALYLRGWDLPGTWEARLRKVVGLTAGSLAAPLPVRPSGRGNNPGRPDDLPRIVDELPTVLAADQHDPSGTEVYNISAQPYPPDPRWYVGFPSYFLRHKNISDGRLEVNFVGSSDGRNWHRYDRQAYVRPGLADADNANMVFIGPGLVVRGDELWQYGTGFRNRHGAVGKGKDGADGVIYRYVQRIGGFVSLDFALEGGRCEMKPVTVDGGHFRVNVDTGALGTLRVGLRDAAGRPIPGFSTAECDPVHTNSTRAEVTWQGRAVGAALVGQSVQVEFSADRTKLFTFYFD